MANLQLVYVTGYPIMDLSHRTLGNVVIVSPAGRIDQTSSAAFQSALVPHLAGCTRNGMPVVLDFAGVEYISSVGLRVLMLASRQVKAQDGRIAVAALKPLVKEVFEISRFNLVFRIFDTVEAASGSFA
jgi:anti-anti-sigma factor